MNSEALVLIDYLINDTKNNHDLFIQRIEQLLASIPNESKIALFSMYKEKKILEIKQSIKNLQEQLETLNEG